MSDTPETDAESFSTVYQGELVKANFARRLERDRDEQCRLLGMSAERECDLRGKLERERALADRLAGALMSTRWDSPIMCEEALTAWKEARFE